MLRKNEGSSSTDEKNSSTPAAPATQSAMQESQVINDVRLVQAYTQLLHSLAEREKLTKLLHEEKSQNEMNKVLLKGLINEVERYKKLNAELLRSKQTLFNEFEVFKRQQSTASTSSESSAPPQMRM